MNYLIIRGLVREVRHWGPFPEQLQIELRKTDPSAEVFTIDFPGFGAESEQNSPSQISHIVDEMRARWLKNKKDNSNWNVLAMSLGGMVALNWISRFPKDFQKLILVNSSLKGLSPIHKRMKPKNIPTVLSLFFNQNIASREKIILEMTSNLKGEALEKRAKDHASFAKLVRKKDAAAQLLAAIRFHAPESISIPLLVLTSRGDQLVDPSCSEQIAKKFKAPIQYHETANHDLPLDAPEWVSSCAREWFCS